MEAKILRMTLNKKWFDMILSGEKKEEYRDIKRYWIQRLCDEVEHEMNYGNWAGIFKKFDYIEFSNGYSPKSRKMVIEFKGIEIGSGKTEWGASSDAETEYFKIHLGKITDTKNLK